MAKRKSKPVAQKTTEQATEKLASFAEKLSPAPALVGTVARLAGGGLAQSKTEARLLFEWNHLTKWQRHALAYKWNLPLMPQARHDQLAKEAEAKLSKFGY